MRRSLGWWTGLVAFAGVLPAQRTWMVDALARPGWDFRDIPPAVAAAAPGDTILVRWGSTSSYTAPTLDRPLRLVGLTDVATVGGSPVVVPARWSIRNIAAGEELLISNFRVWGPRFLGGQHGFEASNCAGRIHLENVWIDGGGLVNGLVSFTDCADVSIHWGTLAAEGQPVAFVRSRVRIANSVVFGQDPSSLGPYASAPTEAMRVENGEVRLVGTLVKGGDGYSVGGWGRAATVLANGTVYAGPGAQLLPGRPYPQCWPQPCTAYGVSAIGTGVIYQDPDSVVSDPILMAPTIQVLPLEQPSASLALVTRGHNFRALVAGPRGGFALLALGLPSWSPTTTPLGPYWLDPSLVLYVGAGPIDATTGLFDRTYSCWSGAPMDLLLCYQGGVLWPDGRAALTEPVRFTVQWPVGQSWP